MDSREYNLTAADWMDYSFFGVKIAATTITLQPGRWVSRTHQAGGFLAMIQAASELFGIISLVAPEDSIILLISSG